MGDESLSRGQRILALVLDWLIVLGLLVGGVSIIGIPGVLNIILIALLVLVIVLIPVAYFKLQKLVFGTTLGRVIVIGLRQLYHRTRASQSAQ